ncbi:hypothetical protein J5U22_01096 [Saccharolobus shibatae]|uniref:Uncharacterized protein n=1 Tax=Saccharolobus shibatae TaxID=2286 RepID=A0A8F5BU71_9CREN|nr:hypothetical protein J5U21_01184 [Saccharolobus shibatae]QXJ34550.1 hypothetical protein J5U22_01096 [Saccharolobus shibatae]
MVYISIRYNYVLLKKIRTFPTLVSFPRTYQVMRTFNFFI